MAIDWNSNEQVVRAAVPDIIHNAFSGSIYNYPGKPSDWLADSWKEARQFHLLVADLDRAHEAVLKMWPTTRWYQSQREGWGWLDIENPDEWSSPITQHFQGECAAWMDAAERIKKTPIGGDPSAVCECTHNEMNHANYSDRPRACNQTNCDCREYRPAASRLESGKGEQSPFAQPVSDRDWPEDFSHENGYYFCKCVHCGRTFTGHKRRVVCKACAERGFEEWWATYEPHPWPNDDYIEGSTADAEVQEWNLRREQAHDAWTASSLRYQSELQELRSNLQSALNVAAHCGQRIKEAEERGREAGLREAYGLVKSKRLECHEQALNRLDDSTDMGYASAVDDCEWAILAKLTPSGEEKA